jgi:hypothetical protein
MPKILTVIPATWEVEVGRWRSKASQVKPWDPTWKTKHSKSKRNGAWLMWYSAYLAGMGPRFNLQYCQKKNKPQNYYTYYMTNNMQKIRHFSLRLKWENERVSSLQGNNAFEYSEQHYGNFNSLKEAIPSLWNWWDF